MRWQETRGMHTEGLVVALCCRETNTICTTVKRRRSRPKSFFTNALRLLLVVRDLQKFARDLTAILYHSPHSPESTKHSEKMALTADTVGRVAVGLAVTVGLRILCSAPGVRRGLRRCFLEH